jgi:hypothetical protein
MPNELSKLSAIILSLIGELQHVRHHCDRKGPNSYSSHDNCKLLLLTLVPCQMRNFMDFPRTGGITGCQLRRLHCAFCIIHFADFLYCHISSHARGALVQPSKKLVPTFYALLVIISIRSCTLVSACVCTRVKTPKVTYVSVLHEHVQACPQISSAATSCNHSSLWEAPCAMRSTTLAR